MLSEKIIEILFREKITQRELTLRLKASRSRISEVLNSMEKKGLIKRSKISERTVIVSINHDTTIRLGILKSSEYGIVVSTLYRLRNIPFQVQVYGNSLDALKDLLTGAIDIVASPLVSGYFFHLVDKGIKPLAGIATGGSGIIRKKDRGLIGTTPLSTMDRESREYKNYSQVYYKSIEGILNAYQNGEIEAASVWEPYLTMFNGTINPRKGMCCSLFFYKKTGDSVATFLHEYLERLKSFSLERERDGIASLMSSILNVDEKIVSKSLKSYIFTSKISRNDLEDQLRIFGLPVGKEVDDFLEGCPEVSV